MLSNTNLTDILSLIQNGGNPQQLVLNMLESGANTNPMIKNLLDLAKNNDSRGIEEVARNFAKERGINYDQAFNSFKQNLGL